MEVEQLHAIKFEPDEGMRAVQIMARLRNHYREGVLSNTSVLLDQ
jgi:hypothetical protein